MTIERHPDCCSVLSDALDASVDFARCRKLVLAPGPRAACSLSPERRQGVGGRAARLSTATSVPVGAVGDEWPVLVSDVRRVRLLLYQHSMLRSAGFSRFLSTLRRPDPGAPPGKGRYAITSGQRSSSRHQRRCRSMASANSSMT